MTNRTRCCSGFPFRATTALLTTALIAALALPSFSQAAAVMPLKTQGTKIVDSSGNEVVLQGVNWFGFETANHAPHGLWSRDYKEMLAQIKEQGFNTIRMPFSIQAMRSSTTSGIDYGSGRNAALAGKTPQQAMDIIIDEAGRQGLMIILDNHSSTDDSFMSPLWYGVGGYTETDWVDNWKALSARYAATPNVIGADLKNEPHGEATWGTGAANDWRRAAELAGNAVLAKAPHWLIFVEGIEGSVAGGQQLDRHWWGGNLEGARNNPVRLSVANRLVYSPHEYGPGVFAQPWFSSPNVESILADRWQKGFGYIHEQGKSPAYQPDTHEPKAPGTHEPKAPGTHEPKTPDTAPASPKVLWKANKSSNKVTATIKPSGGVSYSLTAARGKSRRSASCRSVKLKSKQMMRCSIKLTNGRWKLSAVAKTAAGRSSKSKVFRL